MNAKSLKSVFKIFFLAMGLFYFVSCKNESYSENLPIESVDIDGNFETITTDGSENSSPSSASVTMIPEDLKIIKSANARCKVENVEQATRKINQIALSYGAYIADMRFENSLYRNENRFSIKIPQEHFDAMMDTIDHVVEFVDFKNITTEDITEQFIDIQTRLKTKLQVKERFETILKKNAISVEDILATEDKLRVIQEEIEAAQGKINYLTNKIAYSNIQIDLYETVVYKEAPTAYNKAFGSSIKDGLSFGWELVKKMLLGLIYLWPFIILGALIYFLVKIKNAKKK